MKITKIILIILFIVAYNITAINYNKKNNAITSENTVVVESSQEPVIDIDSFTYEEMARHVAKQYNQDWWLIYNVCKAESHFDTSADHDGGLGKGICGIHYRTFTYWENKFGVDLNYNSSYDQLKMTAIAFSNGSLYRNQWSTYRRYIAHGVFNKYEIKNTINTNS